MKKKTPIKVSAIIIGFAISVILAILFIASAYGGMADPANGTKFALIGMCFPIGLAATILLLATLLILRMWRMALIPIISIIISAGPVLTFFPLNISDSGELTDAEKSRSFTMLTFNVMNFEDFDNIDHERNRSVQYILDTDADIVCLQEGSANISFLENKKISSFLPELLQRYPYYTKGCNDMVLLSKYPFEDREEKVLEHSAKKVVGYDVHITGKTITIFNCHLQSIGLTMTDKELYKRLTDISDVEPHDIKDMRGNLLSKLSSAFRKRAEQAKQLRQFVDSAGTNVIVCGDFNDTPDSFSYRTAKGDDLADAYTECAFGPTITYHANRFYFKIDHILYKGCFKAVDVERGKINSSDHYPLLATFVWNE